MILRWAVRNVVRRPARTVLAVSGVAVAAALLLDMVLLAGGLERSFERLILSRGFQIRLSPAGTMPLDTEATIGPATRLVAQIRADPDVVQAGALLAANLYAMRGDSLETLVAYGVDPLAQGSYEVLAGADLTPDDSTGLLVGQPAALALNLQPGDTLRLAGRLDPQVAAAGVERTFTVRAVVRWLYDARTMRSVGAILPVVQEMTWHGQGDRASAILVRVSDDALAPEVARRLGDALPQVSVNSATDLVAEFRQRVTYFRQVSLILGTVSLIVTILLVTTILTITVNERLGEIATLRALGVQRATVVRQVLVEGALITAAGGGLGVALGAATARYLDGILTAFPGLPADISFFVPNPGGFFTAGLVLAAAGTLAGVWPAWVAARAPIALTLRAEAP